MTRPSGPSRPARSRHLEQPLIDAAVIDDVLAGHEAGLRAAEEGDEVAAFAAGRRSGRPGSCAGGRRRSPRRSCCRARHGRAGWSAAPRCRRSRGRRVLIVTLCGMSSRTIEAIGAGQRQPRRVAVGEIDLRKLDEADRNVHDAAEFALAHARRDALDQLDRRRRNARRASSASLPWASVRKSPGIWRTPGLVTRMSGSGQAARIAPRGPASVVTSAATVVDLWPVSAPISSRRRLQRLGVRATIVTSTPSRASASAAARPRPLLPPQTRALRPRCPRSIGTRPSAAMSSSRRRAARTSRQAGAAAR